MHFALFSVALLLLCLAPVPGELRTLAHELNPGCDSKINDCTNTALVHISSANSSGTFHYLWAFVHSFKPAIFVFQTDNDAQLKVDWPNPKKKQDFRFEFEKGEVYNSVGMEISSLYFINATDNATLYTLPLEQLNWANHDNSNQDKSAVLFSILSDSEPLNGSLAFSLGVFSQAGRSDSIPRLQYTESSNLFEVTLNKVYFPIAKNLTAQAQLVCDLTLAFEGEAVNTNLHESRSIDDEYTPGVFQRFVYGLASQRKSTKGSATNESAYAEWKPVAYYDSSKTIAKSIKVTSPDMVKDNLKRPSILNAYFANKTFQATALNNFKFGIPDDDFDYQQNRFLQFSMAFGLNQVPEETLSMTLKIIIVAGLGLPMILFLVSIVYTIIRKLRSNNDFSTLTEDNN